MDLIQHKAQFKTFLQLQSDEPQAMLDIRKDAFENFLKIGYPTKKHENWQFTNLTSLARTDYQLSNGVTNKINDTIINDHSIDNCHRIVFVNGIFNSDLSTLDDKAKQISVKDMSKSFIDLSNNSTEIDSNPFLLLNNAFVSGGYSINIDSNYIEDKPLHILNIINCIIK